MRARWQRAAAGAGALVTLVGAFRALLLLAALALAGCGGSRRAR
jgi:hypothetical protein